jgi:hypothetical protein
LRKYNSASVKSTGTLLNAVSIVDFIILG